MKKSDALAALSETAMVLAAGFGTRLRPLTLTKPKPLFEVGGRSMLDRALDHLKAAGLRRVVVNAHYLPEQIEDHLQTRNDLDLIYSPEAEILDTGGGVKNARTHFGDKPFFVVNGDLPWLDGPIPALVRMAGAWDPAKMDALMLVFPTEKARGFPPKGDFMMEADGRLWRQGSLEPRPYVWISALLVKPELYDAIPDRAFSNNRIFDLAESRGRLYGLVHDGACYHVGTPEDLAEANRRLETGEGWA